MGNSDLKAFVESHQRLFVLTGAGLQHELRDTRLSGCRRQLEANAACRATIKVRRRSHPDCRAIAAGALSGIRLGARHPTPVLGPQHDRLAALRTGPAQRRAPRFCPARGQRSESVAAHAERGPAPPGRREQGGDRPSRAARPGPLHGLLGRPTPRRLSGRSGPSQRRLG